MRTVAAIIAVIFAACITVEAQDNRADDQLPIMYEVRQSETRSTWINIKTLHHLEQCNEFDSVQRINVAHVCYVTQSHVADGEHHLATFQSAATYATEVTNFNAFLAGLRAAADSRRESEHNALATALAAAITGEAATDPPIGVNTAPTVTVTGPGTVRRGDSVELRATVIDPDENDSHSYSWRLSAATVSAGGSFVGATTPVITYTSAEAGATIAAIIQLTVTDYRGASVTVSHRVNLED